MINFTSNRIKNKSYNQTSNNNKSNRTKIETKKPIIQLIDNQPVEIYCEVKGSRPAPVFSWYLDNEKLASNFYTQWPPSNSRASLSSTNSLSMNSRFFQQNSNLYSAQTVNSNQTTNVNNLNTLTTTALISNQHLAVSTLHFKPTADADGKQLICRAENSLLSDHRLSSIETHVQLDVQCKSFLNLFKNYFLF